MLLNLKNVYLIIPGVLVLSKMFSKHMVIDLERFVFVYILTDCHIRHALFNIMYYGGDTDNTSVIFVNRAVVDGPLIFLTDLFILLVLTIAKGRHISCNPIY
jgi:hypothetical protein